MARAPRRDFRARYGPWAVVAGASQGLGEAYAEQVAALGLNVVLIARREELLRALAERLGAKHGIEARVLALDLAREDASAVVEAETAALDVGLLIYNAALSVIGPFLERPLEAHLGELAVNTRAPMALAYLLGQRMRSRERGHGGIILMSSLASAQGSALTANYAATKAYNLVLAEGLWEELRRQGLDVLACVAGATSTPNYTASAPRGSGVGSATLTPQAVAAETLAALGRQPSIIPGRANRASTFVMRRLLPRRTAVAMMGRVLRGMYGEAE
ncbi:MAG TPA: SDR family NAD(P)-dependent oxidoreductase [Ktedonobacterales bacterium]